MQHTHTHKKKKKKKKRRKNTGLAEWLKCESTCLEGPDFKISTTKIEHNCMWQHWQLKTDKPKPIAQQFHF
jgi:hypothetical protein